jgi:phytoene synthase
MRGTTTATLDIPSELRPAYATCRSLTRAHGTTYYWATQLLPRSRRPHVYALYGFCRYADDIVDDLGDAPPATRGRALRDLGERLRRGFAVPSSVDAATEPVVQAVVNTAATYGIDVTCFERFLASMAMDLTITQYGSWSDLCRYMDGSAAVIGEMMLPILEPVSDDARRPAQDLGLAFQLTNFLRDVGEDLDRGRVYLPQEDLARFGADPHARVVDDAWRALMAFEIDRARRLYVSAEAGIALLPPWSARSIAGAHILYGQILDRIEANDYDVFVRRARVPTARKLSTAARLFARRR